MNLEELKNKKIAILGYGTEGKAVGSYLDEHKIKYEILDRKEDPEYLTRLSGFEIVFRSPGVPFLLPEIQEALKKGVAFTSQMKYFFDNCRAKIIGVTGTKGKGTTSNLIYEILKASGIRAFLGGNIGTAVLDILDEVEPEDYVVLELSSFQLQDLSVSPHIAVVLMVTSEHLDYHSDNDEYVSAKSNIAAFQKPEDFLVVNYDFENSRAIGILSHAKKFYVHTTLGGDAEKSYPIAEGIVADRAAGKIILREQNSDIDFMSLNEVSLPGFHNSQNVCSAIMAAKIAGAPDAKIKDTVRSYKGLEHRLEYVAEVNGIKFYNDSFGTTPESAIAAAKAFSGSEILIIGGFDKKGDYQGLAKELSGFKNIKAVILIGDISDKLERAFKDAGFPGKISSGAGSMADIFQRIKQLASSGDTVVLAPATSSFGMFKDYKDRGKQFKENVLKF